MSTRRTTTSTASARWSKRRWLCRCCARIRGDETEFVTISYWESIEAMSRFAGPDPRRIHHLERDAEFLIELPQAVQVLKITASKGVFGT